MPGRAAGLDRAGASPPGRSGPAGTGAGPPGPERARKDRWAAAGPPGQSGTPPSRQRLLPLPGAKAVRQLGPCLGKRDISGAVSLLIGCHSVSGQSDLFRMCFDSLRVKKKKSKNCCYGTLVISIAKK